MDEQIKSFRHGLFMDWHMGDVKFWTRSPIIDPWFLKEAVGINTHLLVSCCVGYSLAMKIQIK